MFNNQERRGNKRIAKPILASVRFRSDEAHEIMDKVPVTVDTKISIEEAINLLALNNISYLPVLSSEGIVEGIVTRKDIIKFYSKDGNCY